jgi:hypothetical protein
MPNLNLIIFYSNSVDQIKRPITREQWYKFNFLHTLIHYKKQIDILHGAKIPVITILDRANPEYIISHILNDMSSKLLGIFVCGGEKYTESIIQVSKQFEYNSKKITIDIWTENL